jgi:hypothetical protein
MIQSYPVRSRVSGCKKFSRLRMPICFQAATTPLGHAAMTPRLQKYTFSMHMHMCIGKAYSFRLDSQVPYRRPEGRS